MTERIENLIGATQLEVMSPMIYITWNPDNTGSLSFNMVKYLVVDGVIRTDIPPAPFGRFSVDLNQIFMRTFIPSNEGDPYLDPVTGLDLRTLSGAGMMMNFKAAFETLYREWLATQTEQAEPQP